MVVCTINEEKRKLIEPRSAPTFERMKMLKEFMKIGCKTSVLFMPIIPYISDDEENLDEVFRISKEFNLGSINTWPLHLRGNTKSVFYSFLKENFPDLLPKYKILYKGSNVSKEYRFNLQNKINILRNKYHNYSEYKPTQPKQKKEIQLSLFN